MSALAPTLQAFFTDRLIRQRQASNHTLASYRDTLRLLVRFAAERRKVEPVKLEISDLDSALISAFLDHRERECGNSVRTRNTRLTAIRSMFRYAALRHPEHAEVIQHVLAIPPKRFARRLVSFLTDPEVDALLSAPDRTTWVGRRDHTLFATAVQTGLRASELIGLRITDVHLGVGPHVSCLGKGRKQRITPLTTSVVALLRTWLCERREQVSDLVFTTRTGRMLSRDALEHRLAECVAKASNNCPSLREKEDQPSCAAAHGSNETLTCRERSLGHRSLARPRADGNYADLPSCRPRSQRKGTREDHTRKYQSRPLPATRYAPCVS